MIISARDVGQMCRLVQIRQRLTGATSLTRPRVMTCARPHTHTQVVLLVVGVMVFVMNKPSKKSVDTHVVFEWSARSAWGLLLVFGALVSATHSALNLRIDDG